MKCGGGVIKGDVRRKLKIRETQGSATGSSWMVSLWQISTTLLFQCHLEWTAQSATEWGGSPCYLRLRL